MTLLAPSDLISETGNKLETTEKNNRQDKQPGNQIAMNDATTECTIDLSVDAIEFNKRTRLDLNPIRVWWHEERVGTADERVPGLSDYMLKACLELTDADLQKLMSQQQDKPKRLRIEPADWWPAPLKVVGDEVKIERYDARQYSRQPYSDGSLSHIVDTHFIIVEFFSR